MQTSSRSSKNMAAPSPKWFLFLFIVSLLTMATHLYLTNQHYDLKLGSATGPAICNISATFNCDSVAASRYASVAGIPMALLGLISQIAFFILLLATRYEMSQSSTQIRRLLFWFSGFVLVVSFVMGGISVVKLGTYCLFCMAAYVLSIFQMVGAWKIQTESPVAKLTEDLGHLMANTRWVFIVLILVPATSWLVNNMVLSSHGYDKINLIVSDSINEWQASSTNEFQMEKALSQGGGANPVMTIVEFADFLCPHCKMASTPLESFAQAHPDVKLVFKAFALDGVCNKSIPTKGNGVRCKLAAAVMCAEQQSQNGWKAHHWIFEKQDELHSVNDTKGTVQNLSKDLGLSAETLETCMNSDATQELLESMAQEGTAAKIQGTPTIFVNGKLLPRGQVLPVLEAVYQKLKP
jgi:protein-disulfide isomerase/uncharacterized membrane protein